MTNATSLLFENLMNYNDAKSSKKSLRENVKPVKEEDETILNLQVELPQDLEDVKPEDVDVTVGVMPIENEDDSKSVDKTNVDEIDDKEDNEETDSEDATIADNIDTETEKDDEDEKKESIRTRRMEAYRKMKESTACKEDCKEEDDILDESNDFETAKKNILARVQSKKDISVESISRLDTTSLNHLIANFVKDNYKNIDKITISKAVLENKKLTLEGTITNVEGVTESIKLVNKGFDVKKLEGKKFVLDFADGNNTFGIISESTRKPFAFIATLKEGVLKFESMKYNFRTRISESKLAEVSGKCILKESTKVVENADQVKRFNEIVDKIKSAKSANDLSECKDEMDDANLGDTLLSAAQMVWDDVNAKMVAETKK